MRYHRSAISFLVLVGFVGVAFAFEPLYTNFYSNPEFHIYSLVAGDYVYNIPYSVSSGTLVAMEIDCSTSELVLNVKSAENGILIIGIPRVLVDSKFGNGNDDVFFVLEGSKETQFTETVDEGLRVLTIPFSEHSPKKIAIIGANYPESSEQNACNGTEDPPYSHLLLSPLKQHQSGVAAKEIQCKDSLALVIKSGDDTPACVTHDTAVKLVKRNWSACADNIFYDRIVYPCENPSSSGIISDFPSSVNVSESCAAEFDKIINSLENGCSPEKDYVCMPPTLMGLLTNADKDVTQEFAKNNCARTIDDWKDASSHRNVFRDSEVDWNVLANIYDQEQTFAIHVINEKHYPNKVGQEIKLKVEYWDRIQCFDYTVKVTDTMTNKTVFEESYSYDNCDSEDVGKYERMLLRPAPISDFVVDLPGYYLMEIQADKFRVEEGFFVECMSSTCQFLTDEQLQGRQTYMEDK